MSLNIKDCDPFKLLVQLIAEAGESQSEYGDDEDVIHTSILIGKRIPFNTFLDFMSHVRSAINGEEDGIIEGERMRSYHTATFLEFEKVYDWQITMSNQCYMINMGVREEKLLFVEVFQTIPLKRIHGGHTAWNVGWSTDFKINSYGLGNESCYQRMISKYTKIN